MNKKANTIITKYSVTMVMLLIAVWAVSMAQSSIAQAQSESWHFNPANGHYYRLTDWMSWGDTEAQAVQWGGHLVTINDPEEELWLQEQFYPPDMRTGYWIGLNDIEIEGNWVWSSGEMPGYENWCPGEPNDVNGEDAANMEGFPYDNPTQYCWNDNPDYNHRQGIVEKSLLEIAIDIKPTSCPNPLNVVEKGVLPVAILGTAEFDASTIDPASVQLAGVSPLHWSWEDVATPYEPFTGKGDAYDCNEYGADGYMDLALKFDAQEVVAALGDVNDGDVLVIDLTGNLQDAYGGTAFFGEDVVRIIKKKGATECNELVLLYSFGLPGFSHLNDLAFDGEFLWLSGYDSGTISKLDMDGNVLSSFVAPGPFHHPTGLTFDGNYLWSTDDLSLKIYQLDLSGNVLTSFDAPGVDSTGLATEGDYLWNADFNWGVPGGYLHRIDISDPGEISFTTFDSPGEGPSGLAFDGKYLWLTDAYDNTIYKLDTSANVLCSYPSFGGHPLGVTFDGKYLWLSAFETKTIYKIDIGKN